MHHVILSGGVHELHNLTVLPGVQRPRAIDFESEDIHYFLNIAPAQAL